MIIDARSAATDFGMITDTVIVGAGPAGMAIAARLGCDAARILVVESGGLTLRPDLDLARGSVDRPYYDLPETRLRGLGGSSGCWGGWCERLRPVDLASRPWVPHSGWCLDYAELARYYPDAEEFCGSPVGFTAEQRSWQPGGQKAPIQGVFDQTPYTVVGRRNLGTDHRAVFNWPDVDLLIHATVTRIVTGDDGRKVDHLVVRAPGDVQFPVTAHTFVLAAGGVENARLLLLSRTGGWRAGIGNDNGLVGRCFMEHPHVDALRIRNPDGVD
ncbi:MAG: GMC oxidoreductase, partial [Stackebrandtia sp.]